MRLKIGAFGLGLLCLTLLSFAPLPLQEPPTVETQFAPWELVTAVAWSPDGKWIAAGAGNTIELLDAQGLEVQVALPVGALVHALAFSPDGHWLAAGSRDGQVRLWSLEAALKGGANTPPEQVLEAHRKGVNTVAFSPDGRWLASGGNDAVARLWNPTSGELQAEIIGGTFAVPSLAFTPDGKDLAIVNGDVVRLREIESGRIVGTFLAEIPLYSIAFSPDGGLIASGDHENTLRLWDPATAFRTGSDGYPTPQTLNGHNGKPGTFHALVWKLAFSPNGNQLASVAGDGTLRLWNPRSAVLERTIVAHQAAATSFAFSPDGKQIVTGGLDAALRIWKLEP